MHWTPRQPPPRDSFSLGWSASMAPIRVLSQTPQSQIHKRITLKAYIIPNVGYCSVYTPYRLRKQLLHERLIKLTVWGRHIINRKKYWPIFFFPFLNFCHVIKDKTDQYRIHCIYTTQCLICKQPIISFHQIPRTYLWFSLLYEKMKFLFKVVIIYL